MAPYPEKNSFKMTSPKVLKKAISSNQMQEKHIFPTEAFCNEHMREIEKKNVKNIVFSEETVVYS